MPASFVQSNPEEIINEFIKVNKLSNGRSSGFFDNTYYYDSPKGDTYGVCYSDGEIWKESEK